MAQLERADPQATILEGHRILVTGGAGFIGSHLADRLLPDNDVWIIDDLSSGVRSNVPDGATFIDGDVRDATTVKAAVADVDLVFHQAALVSPPKSVTYPVESHSRNVEGAVRILEAARRHNVRVVVASSVALYGQPEDIPISEDHPKSPVSPYALDKLSIDHYARLYHELYDLETVALRYFNVYGPRNDERTAAGVIQAFVDQVRNGGPVVIEGDGRQTRDFVHVDDVVRANLLAATSETSGVAVNVGTGRSISVRELAELIQNVLDCEVNTVHEPPRAGDVRRSRADISRAQHLLDFEPAVTLDDGLRALLGTKAK